MSLTSLVPSNSCIATKYLSKLHGSLARTFIILGCSLKVKRTICSSFFLTLKPFFAFHRGEKVFAIASRLSACRVRNLAASTYSVSASFSINLTLEPSQSDSLSLLQVLARSSISLFTKKTNRGRREKRGVENFKKRVKLAREKREGERNLFPSNPRIKPHKPHNALVTRRYG